MMLLFQVIIFSLCSVGIYATGCYPASPDLDEQAIKISFDVNVGNSLPSTPIDGSITGGITFEPGVDGNAARLPEGSYIGFVSENPVCPFFTKACDGGVSLSFWINFADLGDRYIFGIGDLFCVVFEGSFYIGYPDANIDLPISDFVVNVWNNIAFTSNDCHYAMALAINGTTTFRSFIKRRRRKRNSESALFIGGHPVSRKKRQAVSSGEFLIDEMQMWNGVIDPLDMFFAAVKSHCFDDGDCNTTNGDYCEEFRCHPGGVRCEVDKDCWDIQRCESSFCLDKTYRCRTDDDCEVNEHCHNPYCYPNYLHCEADTHCNTSIPEHCVNNVCYSLGTPCFSDNHCPKEEYCADTICFQPADRCRDNNDCGLDKHCHYGRCYSDAMHCHDQNDCKDGTHCYNEICYTNSERCQANEDCSYYHHCHHGRCYPNYYHCEEDIQCPADDHCHDGVCHPKILHCENHDDCDTDHHCTEGFCIADADQCLDGHPCPIGQHCHDTICYINENHCHTHEDCGPLHHCHEPICYLNSMHCEHDTECIEKGELCIHGICREPVDPYDLVEEEPKRLNRKTLAVIVALSVTAGVSFLSAVVAVTWFLCKRRLCRAQVGTLPVASTPGLFSDKLFSGNPWF